MQTEFAASINKNDIFADFFSSLGKPCLLVAKADSEPQIVLVLYKKEDGPGSRASPTFLKSPI
jgi:hypothetical protein